jgi:dTDP-4-dehydrorhamnose reductase
MAETCKEIDALFVHYSTDYVFDGASPTPYDEQARPNPLNTYGESKLAGERHVSEAGARHVIIRTSWVYSPTGAGFVASLIRNLPGKDSMRIVSDQVGSPTWSKSLAHATSSMIGKILGAPADFLPDDWGVYHLGGSGEGSRVEIAETVVEMLGKLGKLGPGPRPRIVPVSSDEFAAFAPRPHYSALVNRRTEARFGITLAPWRQELARMLTTPRCDAA